MASHRRSRCAQDIGSNPGSLAARIIMALLLRGSTEVASKTNKYRVFTVVGRPKSFYFVGPQGAWRVGRTVAQSTSLETAVPKLLLWHTSKLQQGQRAPQAQAEAVAVAVAV